MAPIAGSPFAAGGGAPSAPASFAVHPTGRFGYTANNFSHNVSAYTINPATGALAEVEMLVAAGVGPTAVAVDPSGRFAYVANGSNANVSAYTTDATTGALSPITDSPFAAGTSPVDVTIDPSGRFAYVTDHQLLGSVSAYTIDPETGALTPITGSPFAGGSFPWSVSVDPSGRFAYTANLGGADVSAYTINVTTGALTPIDADPGMEGIQNFPAGNGPISVTVDPIGKFAYVANFSAGDTDDDVSAYTIDSATGALTPIAGSPFAAGTTSRFIAVDPNGRLAYVVNKDSHNVSAYTIDAATGALTQVAGSPFATDDSPLSNALPQSIAIASTIQ